MNSAISMSCFSFLSVMNGDFFVAAEVPDEASDKDGTAAAFCFLLFISSCKAAAKLPLPFDELDLFDPELGEVGILFLTI